MAFRFWGGRVAHISMWSGLAAASLAVSIPKIYSGVITYSLCPTGPLHTSDSYLQFATGAPKASEKVISIFQSTVASKSIVIFTRKDDAFSSGLGMTVAYLAFPHLVRFIEINGRHPDKELSTVNPAGVAAVVFCHVSRPAWMPPGRTFGSGLEVISIAENRPR